MAIIFQEFDTTQANLVSELVTRITAHADWAVLSPTPVSTTLTATASSTTLTVSSSSGFSVGMRIAVTGGGNTYYRTITSISSGTSISVNLGGWSSTLPIGTTVTTDTSIIKATTTRGAEMIVDLAAGNSTDEASRMTLKFWHSMTATYAAAVPSESADRYVYWRSSGTGVPSQILHVVLSVSKEHLFVSVEGPRLHEPNTSSVNYGSQKNYFFMSDLVPYHAGDTVPCVVAGAGTVPSSTSSVAFMSHVADISRTAADDLSWQPGRLATLTFPVIQDSSVTIHFETMCTIDGNRYLFPYVAFGSQEGIRGRLARFFYAGTTNPTAVTDYSAPVGEKVTYDGIIYKLVAVNKGDSNKAWGPFGAADNGSSGPGRTVVVAVPFDEVTP